MSVASVVEKRCACTGVRWCAACMDPALRSAHGMREPMVIPAMEPVAGFDHEAQCAPGLPAFRGLRVLPAFVSEAEAEALLREIERHPFKASQSGKWKQHFGPRMNFRKRRMNVSGFEGVPHYARDLEARLRKRGGDAELTRALEGFRVTDVFVLRYHASERSNLDLHTDDLFAYGEVILDLSLESDSVLSFYHPASGAGVRAALPARSLAVLFGPARVEWEHAILADDVDGRRTSITLRTLGDALRATEAGRQVVERALE